MSDSEREELLRDAQRSLNSAFHSENSSAYLVAWCGRYADAIIKAAQPAKPSPSPTVTLAAAWDLYESAVKAEARRVFEASVRPFLEARGWSFSAGMGTWCIMDSDEDGADRLVDPERHSGDPELQHIDELLALSVEGMPANDLGSLMPCWEPPESVEGVELSERERWLFEAYREWMRNDASGEDLTEAITERPGFSEWSAKHWGNA